MIGVTKIFSHLRSITDVWVIVREVEGSIARPGEQTVWTKAGRGPSTHLLPVWSIRHVAASKEIDPLIHRFSSW